MANESTPADGAPAGQAPQELHMEYSFDIPNQLVMMTVRHRLELPAAAKAVPIPFAMFKLMAGQVLTIEAQLSGLLAPQGQPAPDRRSGMRLM